MMPPQYVGFGEKADQGFHFIPDKGEEEPLMRIEIGGYGKAVVEAVPKVIRTLVKDGFDLIVDEVVFDEEELKRYAEALSEETAYLIGIMCDLPALQERELLRGDRALGLGREQITRVHILKHFYDLTVDTTKISAFECAQEILKFISESPSPQGFRRIRG